MIFKVQINDDWVGRRGQRPAAASLPASVRQPRETASGIRAAAGKRWAGGRAGKQTKIGKTLAIFFYFIGTLRWLFLLPRLPGAWHSVGKAQVLFL